MTVKDHPPTRQGQHYVMRLFVAGNAPNSRLARENLDRFQASFPEHEFKVEIIDLDIQPELALENSVFITPTLQVLEPAPGGMIYGNLNDEKVLARILRLRK